MIGSDRLGAMYVEAQRARFRWPADRSHRTAISFYMPADRQHRLSIHQFHSGSAVADAVTNSMFFVQSMLQRLGFESNIFAEHLDPALYGRVRRLEDLHAASSDLLLIHHSMGHDAFPRLAALRCRKF